MLLNRLSNVGLVALVALSIPFSSLADEPVDFAREVLPILSNKCFLCHGPDAHDEDLVRLDSYEGAIHDLGGYKAINPEDLGESHLLDRILSEDDPMPPEDFGKPLTAAEKDVLARWVAEGGKYKKHWAFVPPVREPTSRNVPATTMIDRQIEKGFQSRGIGFAPEVDKETLARRVGLVLTGLVPTEPQLERFLDEASKKDGFESAYEGLVDALLASPRFGEHQARYWLDAVRYGDTHGLHLDNRRGIYPFRDWVVKAFNDNLPLDDFIEWQLAGDLLPEPTLEQKVATGYIRLNPSTAEGGAIPAEFQVKNSFDRTENFGTVFLGLSLNCARCHTHKYDPITHTEYYRLLAFFNSTSEGPMDGNRYDYGTHVRAPKDQASWRQWSNLKSAKARLLIEADLKVASGEIQVPGWNQVDSHERVKRLAASKDREFDCVVMARALQDSSENMEKEFTTTLVARELPDPRPTRLLNRGEYDQPQGDPLLPGTIRVLGEFDEGFPRNRLGLAKWLVNSEHPLTSRVFVNQIWQRVFGVGLVRTPEDFGLQGQQPTHPELLDWLAVELRENGWDMKQTLRSMVLSKTFRQSSAWRDDVDDPENKLFARGPSYRLDAEVIRDIGLSVSELLDPHMGGEGVKPYQPAGMWAAMAHPASNTKKYERDRGQLLYRRSLYVYWKRTSPHPMMTLFDAPSRESSCVRRVPTNTSLQSLALLNETQRIEMARSFAERLFREAKTDEERLNLAFRLVACRKPTDVERTACTDLLRAMRGRFAEDKKAAQGLLEIGERKRNDKLDVAEHAAWTQVASTILASDVAILLY